MKGQTWSEREEVRKENWREKRKTCYEKRRNNFNTGQKEQGHHRTRRDRKGQRWAKRTGSWQDEKNRVMAGRGSLEDEKNGVIGGRKVQGHQRTKRTGSLQGEKRQKESALGKINGVIGGRK